MIIYDNRDFIGLIFRKSGSLLFSPSVLISTGVSSVLCVLVFQFPDPLRLPYHLEWPAWVYSTVLAFAIIFRTALAYARFWGGITATVSMLSLWRSAYMNLITFVDASIQEHEANRELDLAAELMESKERLLHWFSLLFAVAIQTLQWREDPDPLRKMPQNEIDEDEGRGFWAPLRDLESCDRIYILCDTTRRERDTIEAAFDKLTHVVYWIQHEVSYLHLFKRLLIGSPILTRVYEELSNGTLAYCEAHTIAFIPFPFLFAQVLSYALNVFVLLCPFIVQASLNESDVELSRDMLSWPSIMMMNILLVTSFACLNELAIELEDPFREKHNNFPLRVLQRRLDFSIQSVAQNQLPRDFDFDTFGQESIAFQRWCEDIACDRALANAATSSATINPQQIERSASSACEELRRSVSTCVTALDRNSMALWMDMRKTELELCGLAFRILTSDSRHRNARKALDKNFFDPDLRGAGHPEGCDVAEVADEQDVSEHCPGRPQSPSVDLYGNLVFDDEASEETTEQSQREDSAQDLEDLIGEEDLLAEVSRLKESLMEEVPATDQPETEKRETNLKELLRKSAFVNGRMAPLLMQFMCFDRHRGQ